MFNALQRIQQKYLHNVTELICKEGFNRFMFLKITSKILGVIVANTHGYREFPAWFRGFLLFKNARCLQLRLITGAFIPYCFIFTKILTSKTFPRKKCFYNQRILQYICRWIKVVFNLAKTETTSYYLLEGCQKTCFSFLKRLSRSCVRERLEMHRRVLLSHHLLHHLVWF